MAATADSITVLGFGLLVSNSQSASRILLEVSVAGETGWLLRIVDILVPMVFPFLDLVMTFHAAAGQENSNRL